MGTTAMSMGSRSPATEAESSGLDRVLDEHAELRDVVAQLRRSGDAGLMRGLLLRLHVLLERHFAREESDPVLCRMLAAPSATGPARDALAREHRSLLQGLEALRDRAERAASSGEAAPAGLVRDVAVWLDRLQEHDARESEQIGWTVERDAGSATAAGDGTDALAVNLRRTAVDVVIPADQALLLEIVADSVGVSEGTRRLLREINHPYVGWSEVLEDLHRRAMGDLPRHLAHPRAVEALRVLCGLYARVAERASAFETREGAVRRWIRYLEKIAAAAGGGRPALVPVVGEALGRIESVLEREPALAPTASARLRRLAEDLLRADPDRMAGLLDRTGSALAAALERVFAHWLAQPDPVAWWREITGAGAERAPPAALADVSHAALREARAALHAGDPSEAPAARLERLLRLPDGGRIERAYLDAAASLEAAPGAGGQPGSARIAWLIRILSSEALAGVQRQALSEIHHAYREASEEAGDEAAADLVRAIFAGLRRGGLQRSRAALALIARIGELALGSGDPARAEVVIDELLDWDVPAPDFSGFTEEWGVRVDPAHLATIRAFLSVVEANPALARPLVSALVVHLKTGGVFVADTDLFQRDVSRLLSSRIAPVYHPVKQLLRMFPVYFSDIGSEGELREVSSRIDEISGRKDPLCHFLRKQCHVESNPLLIGLVDAIGDFWARGGREVLEPYLPESLYEALGAQGEDDRRLRAAWARVAGSRSLAELASEDAASLERRPSGVPDAGPVEVEKIRLLVRLRQLLAGKYELGHGDLVDRIAGLRLVEPERVEALRAALSAQRDEEALEILLCALEALKEVVTSDEPTEAVEDIYRKRHIAVGIPSIYGRYREPRLEAMGLSFRIESLATALFERLVSTEGGIGVTRDGVRRVRRWLGLLLRAVHVEGLRGRGLEAGIEMLDQAHAMPGTDVHQLINVFQTLSRSVEQIVRIGFEEVHRDVLERILRRRMADGRTPARGDDAEEVLLRTFEAFLRDLIAESFGLQVLDRLVGEMLRALDRAKECFDRETLALLLSFDAERCCVRIDPTGTPLDGVVLLGNKGCQIKRLAHHGLPVPPGFVLTTELFRCWPAVRASDELRGAVRAIVRREVARIEERTDARFGDPRRPLLLAVRSGAPFSMPGALDTFLDVGIDEEIAEGLARRSGSTWGAWDAYRRFVQSWGMGHGIPRDRFDALMRDAKRELGVAKKAQIPAEPMREVALRYRVLVEACDVRIAPDPWDQLDRCVELVLASWDAEKARAYRAEVGIAEAWGTAVVVQAMVYGNLHARSGTGVATTCDPRRPSDDVRLHGDFVVQSQGEDVVGGLVETLPITEAQRGEAGGGYGEGPGSLERDFPRIHRALRRHATRLIRDRGMFHQQIEFTFESDDPADLYILQTRDSVMAELSTVPAFVPGPELERSRLATGIGSGGGALSGRVAHSAEDIEDLRRRFPGEPIILLRGDTVPDDLPLVLRSDGMLTSLGGATSHAALVARQLGRTCVVGCRELEVDEARGRSRIGGRTLPTGALVSISGIDGSVYLGRHPATTVRRRRLL